MFDLRKKYLTYLILICSLLLITGCTKTDFSGDWWGNDFSIDHLILNKISNTNGNFYSDYLGFGTYLIEENVITFSSQAGKQLFKCDIIQKENEDTIYYPEYDLTYYRSAERAKENLLQGNNKALLQFKKDITGEWTASPPNYVKGYLLLNDDGTYIYESDDELEPNFRSSQGTFKIAPSDDPTGIADAQLWFKEDLSGSKVGFNVKIRRNDDKTRLFFYQSFLEFYKK